MKLYTDDTADYSLIKKRTNIKHTAHSLFHLHPTWNISGLLEFYLYSCLSPPLSVITKPNLGYTKSYVKIYIVRDIFFLLCMLTLNVFVFGGTFNF